MMYFNLISNTYKGATRRECISSTKSKINSLRIPMIFHNLRGYDSHLIMQDIGEVFRRLKMPINCVPNNLEQYIFLTLGNNLVFMHKKHR